MNASAVPNASLTFLSPVGRLVWGSMSRAKIKDSEGNLLVIKKGPDAGKPTQRFEFGLAIRKGAETHWNQTPWGQLIDRVGKEAFPGGEWQLPNFAWKVVDGDSTIPNRKGRIPSKQEGFSGCWVLAFSSSFPPTTVNANGTAVVPADSIKVGHYIQVDGSVIGNKSKQQPGVFVNHRFVAHSGFGPEISVERDASQAGFGQSPLPPGASTTPVAALTVGQTPAAPATPQVPVSQAPIAPVATPPVQVAPHPSFLTPTPPPAPPSSPVMTAKAGSFSYAQLIANGWTNALLIEHGYIRAA